MSCSKTNKQHQIITNNQTRLSNQKHIVFWLSFPSRVSKQILEFHCGLPSKTEPTTSIVSSGTDVFFFFKRNQHFWFELTLSGAN